MKKLYNTPRMSICQFSRESIVTASSGETIANTMENTYSVSKPVRKTATELFSSMNVNF